MLPQAVSCWSWMSQQEPTTLHQYLNTGDHLKLESFPDLITRLNEQQPDLFFHCLFIHSEDIEFL